MPDPHAFIVPRGPDAMRLVEPGPAVLRLVRTIVDADPARPVIVHSGPRGRVIVHTYDPVRRRYRRRGINYATLRLVEEFGFARCERVDSAELPDRIERVRLDQSDYYLAHPTDPGRAYAARQRAGRRPAGVS
jgi:hypothetical protein